MINFDDEEPSFFSGGDLTASVTAACAAMTWLTPADQAAKSLAMAYAAQIDWAVHLASSTDEDGKPLASPDVITKALYLGPHLLRALDQLGGTPSGRSDMKMQMAEGPRGQLSVLQTEYGKAVAKQGAGRRKRA